MTFGISAGTLLTAAATVGGAYIASSGAKDAAKTQAASADRAADVEKEMFDKQVELQEPWRRAGDTALQQLLVRLGIGGDSKAAGYGDLAHTFDRGDFEADPGYQFRMDEGMKALDRAAAAGGRFGSGRAMKDITRFSQGLASDEYGKAFDRYQVSRGSKLNPLLSIAGLGQTATNQTGAAAGNFGNSMADIITGRGNATAAGQVGSANAWTSALGQGVSSYQQNELLKALRRPTTEDWRTTGNGMPPGYE